MDQLQTRLEALEHQVQTLSWGTMSCATLVKERKILIIAPARTTWWWGSGSISPALGAS